MIRPTLANIGTFEHPNLRSFFPEDPRRVVLHLLIEASYRGARGTTSFTQFLATPAGLETLVPDSMGVLRSGKMLILPEYDFDVLWRWTEARITESKAETWERCIENMQKHFVWEHQGLRS